MVDELCFTPAHELAERIRAGDLSPVDLVDAHLDRVDDVDDDVNAFVTLLRERAREDAAEREAAVERGDDLGPLHGVPVAIKDLTEVEGVRLTLGAEPLADNVAERDAAVVERLEDAGAVVLGKTTTPEFGLKVKTESRLTGVTSTPFDLDRNAGGSSGGSAAAVAAGMAPVAQGSDAGGSVRIPSAFCGVYGLKPSYGRVPMANRPDAFGTHTPMTHEGVHARTVADAALMLDVVAGPHPRDPFSLPGEHRSYRDAVDDPVDDCSVAYSPDLGVFPIDPDVRDVVEDAADAFAEAGAGVEEVAIDPGHDLDAIVQEASMTQWEVQVAALAETLEDAFGVDVTGEHRDRLPDNVVEMAEAGYEHDAVAYKRADRMRTDVFDAVQEAFADHDLLVTPATTVPPFDNDVLGPTEVNGVPVDPLSGWFLTFFFNLTGHPAASIPAGFTDDGLPVGLQVVAPRHDDATVLAASAAFERVRPWQHAYPPL